jgi:hypothetical protein
MALFIQFNQTCSEDPPPICGLKFIARSSRSGLSPTWTSHIALLEEYCHNSKFGIFGYNTYRGWTQTDYQSKHYNIEQKDEETLDDRGRDGGTNCILRTKEKETRLTLHEHDNDDELLV